MKMILAAVIGAGLGFAYYRFVGCSTGACPLSSNPWLMTLYGSGMGLAIAWNG